MKKSTPKKINTKETTSKKTTPKKMKTKETTSKKKSSPARSMPRPPLKRMMMWI
jgi:hypothetical protein